MRLYLQLFSHHKRFYIYDLHGARTKWYLLIRSVPASLSDRVSTSLDSVSVTFALSAGPKACDWRSRKNDRRKAKQPNSRPEKGGRRNFSRPCVSFYNHWLPPPKSVVLSPPSPFEFSPFPYTPHSSSTRMNHYGLRLCFLSGRWKDSRKRKRGTTYRPRGVLPCF
jgi:hypothetical protein